MNIVKGMHVSAVLAEKGELKLGSVHVNMAWSCRKDNNTGVRTNITSKLGTGSKRLPSTIRLHDGAPQMMQQSSHCAVMWGEKANLSLIWTSWTSGPAYGARLRGLICGPLTPGWNMVLYPQKTDTDLLLCYVVSWWSTSMRMSTTRRTMPMYSFKERGFTLRGQCLHSVQPCAKYKQGSATSSPYHQLLKNKRSHFYQGKNFPYSCLLWSWIVNWHLEACN